MLAAFRRVWPFWLAFIVLLSYITFVPSSPYISPHLYLADLIGLKYCRSYQDALTMKWVYNCRANILPFAMIAFAGSLIFYGIGRKGT